MARFDHDTYRSLNESISQVQNPHAALNEALEYTAALEEVLLALCEELGLDPEALMEDLQTPEREREMRPLVRKAIKKQDAARADTARETERRAMRGDPVMRNWDLKNIRAKYSKKHGLRKKGGPNEIIARDNKERKDPTTLYGKGGRKVATLKPTKPKRK
jgi:hypothetical protein